MLPSPSRSASTRRHPVMTQLQTTVSLAHSHDASDQQRAAMKLSELCEAYHRTLFKRDAESFPPVAHALSRLMDSNDKLVVAYSSRALKMILCAADKNLMSIVVSTGIVAVLARVGRAWERDAEILRELLAIIQNVSWGGSTEGDGGAGTHLSSSTISKYS